MPSGLPTMSAVPIQGAWRFGSGGCRWCGFCKNNGSFFEKKNQNTFARLSPASRGSRAEAFASFFKKKRFVP